jgi:hypothetical protein
MTLEQKERRIREIGGTWFDLMRTFRESRDVHLSAIGAMKKHCPQKRGLIQEDIVYYTRRYEQTVDKIIELADRTSA